MVDTKRIRVTVISDSTSHHQLPTMRGEKNDYLAIAGGKMTSIRMRSHFTPCVLSFRAIINGTE